MDAGPAAYGRSKNGVASLAYGRASKSAVADLDIN
jgi:hypothetical protein